MGNRVKVYYKNTYEAGEKQGYKKGKDEGKVEGKIEMQEDIAKRMLLNGVSVENICKLTGISIERIKELEKGVVM